MPEQETLFELPELPMSEEKVKPQGTPRLLRVCRDQYEMKYTCIDKLVGEDHLVRQIWDYVDNLDLSKALNNIKSVEGNAGRPAIDPKILVTLWLFATTQGIGNARLLARLTKEHQAYQWICGGVDIDRKTISNFRVEAGELFEELLVQGVMTMVKANVVSLEEVAQDGMRVRASAGASSFRRPDRLKQLHKDAQDLVAHLRWEVDQDPRKYLDRKHAAKRAAAKERSERLAEARKEVDRFIEQTQENRRKHKKKALTPEEAKEQRVSSTDPEARVMKMPNGGFNPAFNFQFGVDPKSKVVLSAQVTNSGTDAGQLIPMLEEIKRKYSANPDRYLVDGGYASKENAKEMAKHKCDYYAPPKKHKKHRNDPNHKAYASEKDISVRKWVDRMETEEAKEIYGRRMMVELVNAHMRNRELRQLRVRGLENAQVIANLYAVAYNMTRAFTLGVA
jgi:transposase/vacuolar-type H+-ATPase subunit H